VRDRIGGTTARPQRAVALGYRAGWLEYRLDEHGGHWIGEHGKASAEKKVAHHVRVLRQTETVSWPQGPFPGLSEHQREQLAAALTGAVAILTGSPGTGKTHTAAAVIRALAQEGKLPLIAVAAPTGKAAVRITQKLEEAKLPLQATTIHKLLGVRAAGDGGWKFAFDEDMPLPFRCIVVDETSMLDTDLAAALLRACAPGTHLLLVGDVHQLPPVGHGAPLRDLLDAGVPAARLTEIRRNSGLIVESCAHIKDGKSFDPVRKLSDWNKSARNATRKRLNKDLQVRLNKDGEGTHRVFKVGDKIINLKNGFFSSMTPSSPREYVANGDIGRVDAFRGRQMAVTLPSPSRRILVPLGRITSEGNGDEPDENSPDTGCSWDLAYCCTGHKYQGSECPVVIVLVEPAGPLASREWIYTAISRAKELCILIGGEVEIARYVKNSILPQRKTFLVELLKGGTR
jgi:exodeoxyribonuclease V alpha subunit